MRTIRSLPGAALLMAGITGAAVGQTGPAYDPQQLPALQGKVAQYSLTPRGDVDGLILDDGTIVRLPPEEADRLAAELAPGQPLYVEGDGIAGPLGKVIAAQQIGPSQTQLVQVQGPPPPPRGPGPDRRGPPPPR
jgi:hypothetical protein